MIKRKKPTAHPAGKCNPSLYLCVFALIYMVKAAYAERIFYVRKSCLEKTFILENRT